MFALPPAADWSSAAAQAFPSRPIRLIVPWPPGGISDTSARILAQHMSASVGQPVIVDNRAGAGSTIGTDLVAKSSADGYTLLYAEVQKRFESLGLETRTGTPAELAAFLTTEITRFGKLIRETGIKLE